MKLAINKMDGSGISSTVCHEYIDKVDAVLATEGGVKDPTLVTRCRASVKNVRRCTHSNSFIKRRLGSSFTVIISA